MGIDYVHFRQIKDDSPGVRKGLKSPSQNVRFARNNLALCTQNTEGFQIFDVYLQHNCSPSETLGLLGQRDERLIYLTVGFAYLLTRQPRYLFLVERTPPTLGFRTSFFDEFLWVNCKLATLPKTPQFDKSYRLVTRNLAPVSFVS